MAKIVEPGVRLRAERLYQQLDALEPLRQGARRDLLAESQKHRAVKLLRQIPYLGPKQRNQQRGANRFYRTTYLRMRLERIPQQVTRLPYSSTVPLSSRASFGKPVTFDTILRSTGPSLCVINLSTPQWER
jgi:hypothetical protein